MEEHKNKWADHYPQEILDLTWSNTSEEQVKKVYKIWGADDYDKVCIKLQYCNGDSKFLCRTEI